ncbi:MAG: AMP-binding protein [Gammaproteobacteria bacterium]|nr:AMP-binding protein [Gammaproteobacteria bacterium]
MSFTNTMQPVDWIYRAAIYNRDAVAVDAPGVSLTYGELVSRVDAFAAALQDAAPVAGAHVGVCAHNTVEHLIAILAIMASGNVWVPLNPRDGAEEFRAKFEIAEPSLVVADEDCLALVEGAPAPVITGKSRGRPQRGMARMMEQAAGRSPLRVSRGGERTQALKFTGGSSGTPKGVLQPCRAWIAGAINMLHSFRFDARDRFLLAAPLTHGTSCYVTPVLAAGGTLVLTGGRATPESVLEAFSKRGVTATFLPPTLIYMLMNQLNGRPAAFDSLRLLIYGAAPMPEDRVREAQAVFGPVIGGNYGLTEAPQIITALTPEDASGPRAGSAGRAGLMTRVGIMGPGGDLLPVGESGEIVVGGDLVMTGYWNQPEQTAETLKDGWLHTGDLGRLDERGFLFITDRIKDMIISGGFNIFPGEVEHVLAAHPAVNECVVFGVEDAKWGEAVHAAVTLRDGGTVDERALIDFAKSRLGSVKAPKKICFLDDFPRSSVGKVQRRKVRELIARIAAGRPAGSPTG